MGIDRVDLLYECVECDQEHVVCVFARDSDILSIADMPETCGNCGSQLDEEDVLEYLVDEYGWIERPFVDPWEEVEWET